MTHFSSAMVLHMQPTLGYSSRAMMGKSGTIAGSAANHSSPWAEDDAVDGLECPRVPALPAPPPRSAPCAPDAYIADERAAGFVGFLSHVLCGM